LSTSNSSEKIIVEENNKFNNLETETNKIDVQTNPSS
jgi:hypothetical protein